MASPPPQRPAGLPAAAYVGGSGHHQYRLDRRSPSPLAQQAGNKRDKRRLALQDRLNDIVASFTSNRDVHCRKQLHQYHNDSNYITSAALYRNEPLEEPSEDVRLGRYATGFIQHINDALEQRDADLADLAYRHNYAIDELEKDYKFSVIVAEREQRRLLDSLRHRLILNVNQKMTTLQRDKEKLDIADTNSLLHHPTQFSINSAASPGGPQSNRKTRHTRHRLDLEDGDTAMGQSTNGKRKRRNVDMDPGSPGPVEHNGRNGVKEQTRLDPPIVAPLYTLDRLFTDRELTSNLQQATYDVIQLYSASSKRRRVDGPPANPDLTDVPEPAIPLLDSLADIGDVAMDRTPSQLYHATRSAGKLQTVATPLSTLGELAGRQSAADLIGTYTRPSDKSKRDADEYQRAPALTDQEAAEDLKLMEEAMKREQNGDGEDSDEEVEDSRRLLEGLLDHDRINHVGPAGFATA